MSSDKCLVHYGISYPLSYTCLWQTENFPWLVHVPKWDNKQSQLYEFFPVRSAVFPKLFWLELLECFGLVKFLVGKAIDFWSVQFCELILYNFFSLQHYLPHVFLGKLWWSDHVTDNSYKLTSCSVVLYMSLWPVKSSYNFYNETNCFYRYYHSNANLIFLIQQSFQNQTR